MLMAPSSGAPSFADWSPRPPRPHRPSRCPSPHFSPPRPARVVQVPRPIRGACQRTGTGSIDQERTWELRARTAAAIPARLRPRWLLLVGGAIPVAVAILLAITLSTGRATSGGDPYAVPDVVDT